MIGRPHHLPDERLLDCYLAERAGEVVDPLAADHLADCASCAVRFDELRHFMETVRAEGEAEADAVFTPERLWSQHQAILGRLAQVGRPARVISFPEPFKRSAASTVSRLTPRWVAAAAAAGLFVGVAVGGLFFDSSVRPESAPTMLARSKPARTATAPPPVRLVSPASVIESTTTVPADDDSFLAELDQALRTPRTRELLPFDALTPHAQDVSVRLR